MYIAASNLARKRHTMFVQRNFWFARNTSHDPREA